MTAADIEVEVPTPALFSVPVPCSPGEECHSTWPMSVLTSPLDHSDTQPSLRIYPTSQQLIQDHWDGGEGGGAVVKTHPVILTNVYLRLSSS